MYIDNFKKQFLESNFLFLANYSLSSEEPIHKLLACTKPEIILIEQNLDISLPTAYQEFLLWGGHEAGGFWSGSDYCYQDLVELQLIAVEILEANCFPQQLPKDAFVFYMHQGYEFCFFRISEGENPPVYLFNENHDQSSFWRNYLSFSDFLETWLRYQIKVLEKNTKQNDA